VVSLVGAEFGGVLAARSPPGPHGRYPYHQRLEARLSLVSAPEVPTTSGMP
jgi:hypothetical protein